jgi:predicted O-methyltransferase YrrM
MDDKDIVRIPPALEAIWAQTERLGFAMASEPQVGSLLRTLAASKPGGRLLEIGTGTGVGSAWLLAGMDARSHLDSVESDERLLAVARQQLGSDPRVDFHLSDAADFLAEAPPMHYDLVFADTWPGKFTHRDLALSLLRVGGLYVVDDLLPQASWPDGHAAKVPPLIAELEGRADFVSTKLAWASGLMILARREARHSGVGT